MTVLIAQNGDHVAVGIDVPLLSWPVDECHRAELEASGQARILVLDAGTPAPRTWSALEDWVRTPVDAADLRVRAATVAKRAAQNRERPWIDADGLLRFRGDWHAIPEGQRKIVDLLVGRIGTVVRDDELVGLCDETGSSPHAEAVKTTMTRIGRRLAGAGLALTRIRSRGYLLERA